MGILHQQVELEGLTKMNRVLDSIFHSGFDGVYVADHLGYGVKVNEAYTRLTGVQAKELIGRNMYDVVKEGIVSESVTLKVLKEKKAITIVQHINEKEFLVTGSPVFGHDGEITHVVTNLRDMSELIRLKRELRESKKYTKQILDEINEFKNKEEVKHLLNGVIAQSKEVLDAINIVKKVSKVDSTVLLLGETGVGKEVFANMIHMNSHRSKEPFIKINCGAIPPQLLESELFGYEKGAFTGADRNGQAGLFEKAEGGTIFLDEIGEVPIELQVKLLRVLQEFEVRRIGSSTIKKVDVRIISATNQDLEQMVKDGKFRADLFYRLNIVPILIPPLRRRVADIAPLAYFFLNKVNEKYKFQKRFHSEVIYAMEHYDWPGNIREMENLVERIAVTTDHEELTVDDFPNGFFYETTSKEATKESVLSNICLKGAVAELERRLISDKMSKYKTTRKAAEALNVSQSTIVKKMKKLGISL
ncbi:PAS domain-containing protein [bacterium LRH843]|nr:PAS domain-containing protein [bacterium LRH843]